MISIIQKTFKDLNVNGTWTQHIYTSFESNTYQICLICVLVMFIIDISVHIIHNQILCIHIMQNIV